MIRIVNYTLLLFIFTISFSCNEKKGNDTPWEKAELLFEDDGTGNWQDLWMMDGMQSKVINTPDGMELIAGPHAYNDSSHTVLWTKQEFEGDILIQYDYTRTDTAKRFVNILYFHATGSGDAEHPADIALWAESRKVPSMRTYFNHMNTYHVSYAAFGPEVQEGYEDYVRMRRYIPDGTGLEGTDIEGDIFKTGLFKPNVTYQIQIAKYGNLVQMMVQNKSDEKDNATYSWDISTVPECKGGRIGLRHMFTRSARYKNFKVWKLQNS